VCSAAERSCSRSKFRVKRGDANSIEASDRKKSERSRNPARDVKLSEWLAELHRTALIDQYVDPHVLFLDELTKHQAFEPREDAPIDVTEIISHLVLSKVAEFDGDAAPR